ncbi:MAG TPA: methyltransferase domain-containing protein, partial [Chthonomonadaceae bacterium]|nr:methyltransferase domain-containing protein [Chthonomonadaceae bacterium]
IGIEYAPEQLARVLRPTPNLRFLRGDAHRLPFPDNRFDVVYCRYVLEHVRDPLRVLQEMRRVLKPGGRALAQENDIQMVAFDPDSPAFAAVWQQVVTLQERLGGDALIGRRLFGLFHRAGFREIELSYQPEIHPADKPTFRPWIENCITLLLGVADALQAQQLATQAEVQQAIAELQSLLPRDDACALFHWNRACGVK